MAADCESGQLGGRSAGIEGRCKKADGGKEGNSNPLPHGAGGRSGRFKYFTKYVCIPLCNGYHLMSTML